MLVVCYTQNLMFRRLSFLLLVVAVGLSGCVFKEAPLPEPTSGPDVFLKLDTTVVEDAVPRNATLATLLASHDMPSDLAYQFVEALREVFDPRDLRSGHPYKLIYGPDGRFRRFEYHVDDDRYLQVKSLAKPTSFDAILVDYEKRREQVSMRGEINQQNNSLFAAMMTGGGDTQIAVDMAQIFSGEIDFNTEVRLGDNFTVLYERFVRDEIHITHGDILAAAFENEGRQVYGFRFEVPGEAPAYFDTEGRSLKRQFLKSPFRFDPRVTSRFSYRRLHPVLGTHRPHLGVDYGAPTGTPVIAVANGTVVSAANSGGSGNMVRLRHNNGYETYYLHLSRFAQGMRRGARVAQGSVIGYVGSTGLSTGPHLDYRIRRNGTFVNPLTELRNMPPGDPIPDEQMAAFLTVRDRAIAKMAGRQPSGDELPVATTQ